MPSSIKVIILYLRKNVKYTFHKSHKRKICEASEIDNSDYMR